MCALLLRNRMSRSSCKRGRGIGKIILKAETVHGPGEGCQQEMKQEEGKDKG